VPLLVRRGLGDPVSTVLRLDLASGAATPVAELDYPVNAAGRVGWLTYGMAGGNRLGPFPDGAHVVAIDDQGRASDLGPVRGTPAVRLPPGGLTGGSAAGAAVGTRLLVREGGWLVTIDLDAASPSFLAAVAAVRLRPAEPARTVDDFDAAGGLLYGVSSAGEVVRIDPGTGEVRAVPLPGSPPGGSSYGAAVVGPDGALYALANDLGGRGRLFRVPLNGTEPAREVASGPGVAASDAAGCPPPPPPSPSPAPTSTAPAPTAPPPTVPPPRPSTAAPSPTTNRPSPGVPPGTAASSTATGPGSDPGRAPGDATSAAPSPVTAAGHGPLDAPPTAPPRAGEPTPTDIHRRWGLTVLLLVLGVGAAVRLTARRR
jgi:hypothetical protein